MMKNVNNPWKKLPAEFYERADVVTIARELVGKILVTNFEGHLTAGRIVETEAYNGAVDMASHARKGRRTNRTEVMFGRGGVAYFYLCYGIHELFNVVTNLEETPHAILIRALEPLAGTEQMLLRSFKTKAGFDLTRGPGNVSKALGISTKHTGVDLLENEMFIIDDGFKLKKSEIIASPRVGVDYAQEDALLPYRFYIKNNTFVSGKKK
jgi:DNA-3-methyladenine glycosylase